MKKRAQKSIAATVLSLLLAATAWAGNAKDKVQVNLIQHKDGVIEVDGSFTTDVEAPLVWQQLSNYDGLADLVSSMKESKVLERDHDTVMVRQRALGQFLFFSRTIHLTLKIKETPLKKIAFEDVSRESFYQYRGSWTLEASKGEKLLVRYRLTTRQKESVPGFVLRHVAGGLANDLLHEVYTGILKASQGGATVAAKPDLE